MTFYSIIIYYIRPIKILSHVIKNHVYSLIFFIKISWYFETSKITYNDIKLGI